jgi:molybdopterin molybdotransferase
MTPQTTLAPTPELTPLAEYLAGVLKTVRPLPALTLELTEARGGTLAETVRAPSPLPAFDHASIDGYAACSQDLVGASSYRPVRLNVVGDLAASSWRPVRIAPGTCFAVAAGAPLPAAADVVVPPAWTDQGMASVEIREAPRRGHGLRRAGEEIRYGSVVGEAGATVTPALMALLAAVGTTEVAVRPSPRVVVISIGDELVDAGRISQAGQVVDANSHALAAAATEAGAQAQRIGICDDDPTGVRGILDDQVGRADLIVTTGGTGTGPGDVMRRVAGGEGLVRFTDVSLFPCTSLGFGWLSARPGPVDVPVICLPGSTGPALIGFEVLARPVIRKLAGADLVFRPSVRAHLLATVASPLGLREFRPALVNERRGGGYTAQPLPGGPYTLSGMAGANGLLVLGERVGNAAAGSTVDVLLLDRSR